MGVMTEVAPFTVEVEQGGAHARVGVLWLEQPGKPVIVLDHALILRLDATLRSLPKGLCGLVLASRGERAFVAGADLKAIQELEDTDLLRYLAYASGVYGLISELPFPTAAAIQGAALGGGLELAMHCDGLIGAPTPVRDGQPKAYPVGLPEAGLGICPGWGGTCLLPARIDAKEAIWRTSTGKPMSSDEAIGGGLFDAVAASAGELLATAKSWVAERAKKWKVERDGSPLRHAGRARWSKDASAALESLRGEITATEPGSAVAMAVDAGVSRGWRACLEVEQRELVRLRHTPEARAAIEAFFARAKK
jgi:enoyl-CoA hydratase/carnithine racemase